MQIRTFACSSRVLGFPLSFRYGKANGSNSLAWENNATPQEEVNKRQICFPRQEVANRFPKVRGNYLYGAWNNTTVAVRKLVRRKVRLECDTNKAIYLLPIGDRAYVLALEGECWKCLLSISKTLQFVVTFFEHVSKQCVSISLTYNSTSVYFLCLH